MHRDVQNLGKQCPGTNHFSEGFQGTLLFFVSGVSYFMDTCFFTRHHLWVDFETIHGLGDQLPPLLILPFRTTLPTGGRFHSIPICVAVSAHTAVQTMLPQHTELQNWKTEQRWESSTCVYHHTFRWPRRPFQPYPQPHCRTLPSSKQQPWQITWK